MANGRCALHGGKATGATDLTKIQGEANSAYTHGIYTKFYRDDEKALLDVNAVKLGQVDDELRVMRIRLKRALEAQERWSQDREKGEDGADHMSLVEVSDGTRPAGKDGDPSHFEERKKRLPDFDKIIDATIARIESLEKTRKELLKEGGPGDGDETGDAPRGEHHVTFTGGLTGTDGPLPSPFDDE